MVRSTDSKGRTMKINWKSFALGTVVGFFGYGVLRMVYIYGRFSQHQDLQDEFIRQEAADIDDDLRELGED